MLLFIKYINNLGGILISYQQTYTWKSTLGITDDGNQNAINRLKSNFEEMRTKVAVLANEIASSLPDFTVHDISHIDSLWEMADIICGDDYPLNPIEGFVLGGAFLLHDVAMSIQSYPNGVSDLEKLDLWKDTVVQRYKALGIPAPSRFEYEELTPQIRDYVVCTLLRKLHAETAEKIVNFSWPNKVDQSPTFLINDVEIRQGLGRLIGKIAHSHWWDLNKVESEFERQIGAPGWCSREWKVDPLKVACVLRACDASHIDARRAPSFLRTVRKLDPYSDLHWDFQSKLLKPYLSGESLYYSSASSFPVESADSWWLCHEALEMIDNELRSVDSLLTDKQMPRFSARRVFGVESPERLTSLIPTDGWQPIDATIHIGDLPSIIRSLGGYELYGNKPETALRELIQNSSDAIKARRKLEGRDDEWGKIQITAFQESGAIEISIEDNGIGMSLDVIKKYLFDFGSSYWNSELLQEEHPGLISKDVPHTGKYGIGFFSIFMMSEQIKIITRKCTDSQQSTKVIEFREGLSRRPIIRNARTDEYLIDGGTKISLNINDNSIIERLFPKNEDFQTDLVIICNRLAPALDVDLHISDLVHNTEVTHTANSWMKMSDPDFCAYMNTIRPPHLRLSDTNYDNELATNVKFLYDESGKPIGRGWIRRKPYSESVPGLIVVNGLTEGGLRNVSGIFFARNENAARDVCSLIATNDELGNWATEQFELAKKLFDNDKLFECSSFMKSHYARNKDIPFISCKDRQYSELEFIDHIKDIDKLIVTNHYFIKGSASTYDNLEIYDNVYFIDLHGNESVYQLNARRIDNYQEIEKNNAFYRVSELLSEAWGMDVDFIVEKHRDRHNNIPIAKNNNIELSEYGYVFDRT